MKPTEILKDEHRAIERLLNVFESALVRTEQGKTIPVEFFQNSLHFIRSFADGCHHRKEENLLFPAMEQKGFPHEGGPIAVMLLEHNEGRSHIKAIQKAIDQYSHNPAEALQNLIGHGHAFVRLLREHIMKEDNVLFVMADQHLSEEDQTILLGRFQEEEQHGPACMQKQELLRLLESLEHQSP